MAIRKSELYSSLWASCDELRGGMDASQYKDYVLVLLFIKYISDKYAGQPYAPLVIPEGSSFEAMVALKGKAEIGDDINKKIIAPLVAANQQLSQSDFPDFNDQAKLGNGKELVERLTSLIAIFEDPKLNFSRNRADDDDILGDAYEYLMRHFASESGKSKGQFYTPSEVIKTGVAEAIQQQFGKGASNRKAVAETIENNIRRTIISERANDPDFYDRMSQVLDEIIRFRKQQAEAYEEYLRRVADLARQLSQQIADNTPSELDTPGKRALWNNLNGNLELALRIDSTVRQVRPDGWRGVQTKDQLIKAALFGVLQDAAEVERLFPILVAQPEY